MINNIKCQVKIIRSSKTKGLTANNIVLVTHPS